MLKRKLCQATLSWKLHCPGPLLIADGRYRAKRDEWAEAEKKKNMQSGDKAKKDDKGPHYPDQVFISRTAIDDVWKIVTSSSAKVKAFVFDYYIPGASLRGPLRAQAERILRSIGDESKIACDPFAEKPKNETVIETPRLAACSHKLEKASTDAAYARICPACKLFGCAGAASRVRIADAEIVKAEEEKGKVYRSTFRDMIGIDRFSGGVHNGANMHFHVLENVHFTLNMEIDNFELWHLGLLAYVFRDVQDGLLPIGAGKTKGFGLIKGKLENIAITLTYPGKIDTDKVLHDMGSLATDEMRNDYGFQRNQSLAFTGLQAGEESLMGLYRNYTVKQESIMDFWTSVAGEFNRYLNGTQEVAA